MLTFTRRLARAFREDGAFGTVRRVGYHCYESYREWSLGIDTATRLYPYGDCEEQECRPYEPLCYTCIDAAMLRLRPRNEDVLLDYGCGRGRVLAVAAKHPFRKVIGIELNSLLCERARENMRRVRGQRCGGWEIVEGNAVEWPIPDDVTVAFLFNPFLGDILASVVQRLRASLAARPRRLSVIYMNPVSDRDVFAECSWLSLKAELPVGLWRGMRFRHYQSVAQTPPSSKGVELWPRKPG